MNVVELVPRTLRAPPMPICEAATPSPWLDGGVENGQDTSGVIGCATARRIGLSHTKPAVRGDWGLNRCSAREVKLKAPQTLLRGAGAGRPPVSRDARSAAACSSAERTQAA